MLNITFARDRFPLVVSNLDLSLRSQAFQGRVTSLLLDLGWIQGLSIQIVERIWDIFLCFGLDPEDHCSVVVILQ